MRAVADDRFTTNAKLSVLRRARSGMARGGCALLLGTIAFIVLHPGAGRALRRRSCRRAADACHRAATAPRLSTRPRLRLPRRRNRRLPRPRNGAGTRRTEDPSHPAPRLGQGSACPVSISHSHTYEACDLAPIQRGHRSDGRSRTDESLRVGADQRHRRGGERHSRCSVGDLNVPRRSLESPTFCRGRGVQGFHRVGC
jgi:hypothetical protein